MLQVIQSYQTFIFWTCLFIIIALRLLSMWAFDQRVLKALPAIRFFNPNNWFVFRLLSVPAAIALTAIAFQRGSYGHSFSNAFYGLAALYPSCLENTGRLIRKLIDSRGVFFVFALPTVAFTFAIYLLLMGETSLLRWGYSLQAGGSALLCAGFMAMMAKTWGEESAGTWSFLLLATAWDILLLLGVLMLYLSGQPVFGFVVFEIVILAIELVRIVSKLGGAAKLGNLLQK
ncbi:MAG: hypothetical protein ACK5Y6_01895 [Pseudomonadota bacterium]